MRVRSVRAVAGAALVLSWIAAGARGEERPAGQYAIPGHGTLRLKVPADWREASTPQEQPDSLRLHLIPGSGDAFSLQVHAVWLDPDKLARASQEIKAATARAAEGPLKQAVEKTAVLQDLRGADAAGYYFSLTDRAPPPEEYKYLTQGAFLTGEIMVTFTFLHRDMPSPEKDQALRILAAATHSR